MFQVYILYKIKLRNKCKFYNSFFSIESIKNCYIFYALKEIAAFLLTGFILFFFYRNIDNFGLSKTEIPYILFVLLFIQQLSYNKTTKNYIQINLDVYRLSSTTFLSFLYKTVLSHCIADFYFKAASVLPVIIFSCLQSPETVLISILGILTGFIISINETVHSLTTDAKSKFKAIISFLKTTFGLLMTFIIFTIGFRVVNSALFIVKILLTASNYEEALLLNDLMISFMNSLNWLKGIFYAHLPVLVLYFFALIVIPIIFNLIQYFYLWKNRENDQPAVNILLSVNGLNQTGIPFFKMVYKQRLNTAVSQLKKQPEILAWIIIEFVILYNIGDDINKFLFIIWFYFIGNANYIRSLFVFGSKSFSNYKDNVDLYYWRLADRSVWDIYKERLKTLELYTYKITLYQCIISCAFSFMFLSDWRLILFSVILAICLRKPMQLFNCKLASFSGFFTFANSCKSKLRTPDLDESELVEDKLQNVFKLPFTLMPMIVIVMNYIYCFLNVYSSLLSIILFIITAIMINKQIRQYLKKAGDVLEKVNVLD